jgi:cysteinyl-tRNA synthetase
MDKDKMSKSSGDFLTLQSLVDSGYDPLDYRYLLLGAHYRSQLQFSWTALDGAKNSRKSLTDRIRAEAEKLSGEEIVFNSSYNYPSSIKNRIETFNAVLQDDFNTPRALAELWGLVRSNEADTKAWFNAILEMDNVLGLDLGKAAFAKEEKSEDPELVNKIEELIIQRIEAKKAKDFATADKIRNELNEQGIALVDTPSGTQWKRI